ncbi:hypothetical protein AAFC00_000202 [Neodothiora populina]|uniref:Major facilitator superfamily (MFS) profile domain-containing protein n=1 Tax=Neodothiora populina TaxID=2781224 RepID=A0ABR3P1R9_9PEZI
MQSLRQYKKFREALEGQIERTKTKTDTEGKSDQPPQSSQTHLDQSCDLEKGDRYESHSSVDTDTTAIQAREATQTVHDPECARERILDAAQRPTEAIEEPVDDDGSQDNYRVPESLEHRRHNDLSRLPTQQSERPSLHSMGTSLGRAMTGVQVRRRKTHEGGEGDVFIVGYEGHDDPQNPHNWTMWTRILITFAVASIGFVVGVASSIDSSATKQAAAEFGVSEVAESCATGLYLIGFGAGALFAGPFSETLGRNPVYIVTMLIYMIFIMASGLAPNLGAQLAFRFLAGFFGSTPLTCAGGSLSDIWNPIERTTTFPIFANAAFLGPILGPVMGGFIAQSHQVSWRWTEWTTLIMSGLVFGIVVLFLPETFPPILLKWKAQHLRELTGDDRYRAEVEIRMDPFMTRLGRALYRPFLLTATEPIIMVVAVYMTVIYIILFTFLDGYDFIFGEIHGVSQGVQGLCFLGIAAGLFLASAVVLVIRKMATKELAKLKEQGKDQLPPEFRLWFSMIGAPAIPISMFWMGWTSDSNISIWSPIAASVLFGFGILCVFISCYQYVIDSYEIFAASALASITLIRYVAAGGMTIAGIPFYQNLGVHYTCTILGCIAAACTPVPYLFYIYGPKLRKMSNYAPTD